MSMNKLDLELFFPEDKLQITKVEQTETVIHIYLRSQTKSCICPKCGHFTEQYHGTYIRTVQDLPVLGKTLQLHIRAHEYDCTNQDCDVTTIAESFDGFLNTYSRMTERCADFICTLALETSCEGCSRICKVLGIKISGDTVIRLLLKRYQCMEEPPVGDVIGIDDFAYKKRHTYGTIIVDEKTHAPITLLDGRDGNSLREWLKNNKHIKIVTRDRASAYAKVIAEELPDAMQVADRFHLHQNLLEKIKNALNHELPATIKISHTENTPEDNEGSKKNGTRCG
ncbi:transposase [Murimonas intestini]|uniref:Transposase IS204/IS1001/IS1096/IS1165 family protein n=1 Tax=Murimonas intestini TaxID=1337051 RepID=A0AB73T098_9FIRM|nr:transposase [Murimonas intestini]MCR1843268.1 transposase [Murimonas intestini]MCR1868639.1 transposase [Murimonas intestini]MCR1885073.1 transposase [Murimonas intestini]